MNREELLHELHAAEARGLGARGDVQPELQPELQPDMQQLIEDLRTHQIELELQNHELREAHGRLEESRARYSDLYDFAPVGYCTLTPAGIIQDVNLTGASLLGIERANLLGRPFTAAVRTLDRDILRAHLRRCAEGNPRVTSELQLTTRDGRSLVLQLETALAHGSANAAGYPTAFLDVTERKWAEEAVRFLASFGAELASTLELESLFRLVTETPMPLLANVCVLDLIAPDGTLRRSATAAFDPAKRAALLAFDRDRGGHPALVDLASRAVSAGAIVSATLDDDQGLSGTGGEPARLRAFGLRRCTAIPLQVRGRTIGVLTLGDADGSTAPRLPGGPLAEQLGRTVAMAIENCRLYREATDAVASRDTVLAVVSHDLRNLVWTAIMNLRAVLQRVPEQERRQRGRKQMETVQRTAEKMLRLIDDLLDTAAIETGRLTIERHPHLIAPLVEEAMELFQPQAARRHQRTEKNIRADATVDVDRDRILQVFANLLGNAGKFTPEGGSISIEVERAGDEVVCAVCDSGPGIASHDLAHIFERFWQGRRSDRASLGLGLAIARGIVEAHGGRLWAESRVGEGSRFLFTLSALAPQVPRLATPATPA